MGKFKKERMIVKSNLINWRQDYRIWIIFISVSAVIIRYLIGFTQYGLDFKEKIPPWIFSFLFSDFYVSVGLVKILLYFGVILLFCDAPFLHEGKPYIIARSGRKAWWRGEAAYIFLVSLIYTGWIFLLSVLTISPVITLHQGWGSAIPKISSPPYWQQYILQLGVPQSLVQTMEPCKVLALTFLYAWLSFAALGGIIFLANLASGKNLGALIAATMVLSDPLIIRFELKEVLWLSPVNWSSLQNFRPAQDLGYPPDWYPLLAFPALFIVLGILIGMVSRRCEIKVTSMQ